MQPASASPTPTPAPPALYLIDVTSGASSLLASDGSEPLWAPDGKAVAFLTARQEIAVVTLIPGSVSTVGKGWGYTWSVDGRRLAFLSAKPAGRPMLWDRESGEVKTLLERDDVDGLSWSPDGKEIVVSLASGGGLWLAGSDGSNLRKLGDGRDPIWAWPPRAGR
jgi:Tol biopolymer transport system component